MTTLPVVPTSLTPLVILLGPPGTGKSTFGKRLAKDMDWHYLSVGGLVKAFCADTSNSQRCVESQKAYEAGQPQPDEFVVELTEIAFAALPPVTGLLIDAFPLSIGQAHALDALCERFHFAAPFVIFLNSSEEVVLQRVMGRATCLKCNIAYGPADEATKTDVCPRCGGPLTRRKDDKPEVVHHRYAEYRERLGPVEDYYRAQNNLVELDGEQDLETVYASIMQTVTTHLGS